MFEPLTLTLSICETPERGGILRNFYIAGPREIRAVQKKTITFAGVGQSPRIFSGVYPGPHTVLGALTERPFYKIKLKMILFQ